MKTEDRGGVRPCLRRYGKSTHRGIARGRPRWRSSFLGDPGAKVFWELTGKAHRRSRGGGKSENPAASCGIFKCRGKVLPLDFSTERLFPRPFYPPTGAEP